MIGSVLLAGADTNASETSTLADLSAHLNLLPAKSIRQWTSPENAAGSFITENDSRTSEARAMNVFGVSRDKLCNVSNNIVNYEHILATNPQGVVFFTYMAAFLFNGFCAFQSFATSQAKLFVYESTIASYQRALKSALPDKFSGDILALSAQLNAASDLGDASLVKDAEEKIVALVNDFAREHRSLVETLLKEKTEARLTANKLDKTLSLLDAVAADTNEDEIKQTVSTLKKRYNLRSATN